MVQTSLGQFEVYLIHHQIHHQTIPSIFANTTYSAALTRPCLVKYFLICFQPFSCPRLDRESASTFTLKLTVKIFLVVYSKGDQGWISPPTVTSSFQYLSSLRLSFLLHPSLPSSNSRPHSLHNIYRTVPTKISRPELTSRLLLPSILSVN